MSAPSAPALRQWLTLAAALLLLNAALTLGNVWPTPWIEPRAEISVEVAALVLGLAVYADVVGDNPGGQVAPPRVQVA